MMDDERDDREMTEAAGTSRRRLLRAATGGFALAACGLFLPAGLEETAAREGALGGAMGGRHGKNHRGREHRRHQHKRDHQRAPGHNGATLDVALYVHTKRDSPTWVDVSVWQGNNAGDSWAKKWNSRQLAGGRFDDFRGSDKRLCAELVMEFPHRKLYVEVWNPPIGFPHLFAVQSTDENFVGWSTSGWNGSGDVVANQGMDEWERVYLDLYMVTRLNDTDNYKQFQIDEL